MRRAIFAMMACGALGLSASFVVSACNDDNDVNIPADAGQYLGSSFGPVPDPGPGGLVFSASGEVLALTGYPFPPASPDDPQFYDGWDVHFDRLLVTLDHLTVSENPDSVPGDQSKTGALVAQLDGPWAIDLAHADRANLPGKGSPGEQAIPFASLASQNKNGGGSFATDGTRYAFGFSTVSASAAATKVNLDADALASYTEAVAEGCTVLYEGTATFKGDKTDPSCYPPAVDGGTDYTTWPDTIHFHLCFKSPTSYENCQNPDNQGDPFPNEEFERGIALDPHRATVTQITIHTDHPFWDSVIHDSPAHFDQFASRLAGQANPDAGADASAPTVTLGDVIGVDYIDYTDALGKHVPWRYCSDPPTDAHPKFLGPMAFDPQSVPRAQNGNPATGLRDYADFSVYDQSTQGHLNADGLCFVARHYPSPP